MEQLFLAFIISTNHKPLIIRKEFYMLNQTVLTGNLGADPEVFYSSEGNPVASFNLAFKSSKKKTGWIKCVAFNKLAEVTEKYLHKGARIGIIGTLDQQKWETDEGVTRNSYQLITNSLEFIKTDGRGFEENQNDDVPF
jgi:single-strand DNA-binding protein